MISTNTIDERMNRLTGMSADSLKLLNAGIGFQQLAKGKVLLKEGQVCRSIYFIEYGQLRTFYNKNGKEININFSFENNFVTNLKSLLTNAPSQFYIAAAEATKIWKFDKEQLFQLYSESKEIESFGRRLLEKLLIRQEDHSNLFKLYSPKERYHYVVKYHPKLLQRVSLSQLSSYLGISRETISRIRKSKFSYL